MFIYLIYLLILCFLIIASMIDIDKRIIPNWLTFSMVFLGVIYHTIFPNELAISFGWYFGIILLLFSLVVFLPEKILGGGDLKLYAGIFALVGSPLMLLYIITISNIISYLTMSLIKKKNIAHAPHILFATLLVFLLTV